MKKLLLVFAVLSVSFCGFCDEILNQQEKALMENVTDFRWKLGAVQDFNQAAAKCDEYISDFEDGKLVPLDCISPDINLAVRNIICWEKYNALYEIDQQNKANEKMITDQYAVNKAFFASGKNKVFNRWLYTSSADNLCCTLQYLSMTQAMNEGLTIKKYYEQALAQDPDMVMCLVNFAQWYYHAPSFAGGGKEKAFETFRHASEAAETDAEKYYSSLMLSQIYFSKDDRNRASALLDECEKLLPGSRNVALYRKINAAGYSYFEYPQNRKKIDAKIAGM